MTKNPSLISNTCITQGETLFAHSVSSRVKHSGKWFARSPASVLLDGRVSSDAARIFGLLALTVRSGNETSVGMRELGRLIGKSAATTRRRILELVHAGHLEYSPPRLGQRALYRLLSPVFEALAEPIPVEKHIRAPIQCSQCRKMVRGVGAHGYCRGCANALEIVRRVGLARQELGAAATMREIAQLIGADQTEGKIRRALRRARAA